MLDFSWKRAIAATLGGEQQELSFIYFFKSKHRLSKSLLHKSTKNETNSFFIAVFF